jgi:hypothetical protein
VPTSGVGDMPGRAVHRRDGGVSRVGAPARATPDRAYPGGEGPGRYSGRVEKERA